MRSAAELRTTLRRSRLGRVGRRGRALAQSGAFTFPVRRVLASGLVDREWYEALTRRRFRDDRTAAAHALAAGTWSYLARGRRSTATVNPLFAPEWYSARAWGRSPENPLVRYLTHGGGGRGPHPWFDEAAFIARHPDAASGAGGALGGFLRTCGPDTPLPLPWGSPSAEVPWKRLRQVMLDAVLATAHDRELVAERISDDVDERAVAAVLARWTGVELPGPGEAPGVSVITPVRNRPEQIVAAIASVQAQTTGDWEMVVVDDGSTDTTPEVIAALAAADPRVVLVRGPAAGVSAARNAGLALARGEFVAFLDSDNTWLPDHLQVMRAAMTTDHLGAAYAGVELVQGRHRQYRFYEGDLEHLLVRNHVDLNALVVRRDLLDEVGHFDETLRRCVDHDLVIRLALVAPVPLVRFVGVRYLDEERADRITSTEAWSWVRVVLAKYLVDWDSVAAQVPARVANRVSVVIATSTDAAASLRTVRSVLDSFDDHEGPEVELVVLDNGGEPATAAQLRALEVLDSRVRVLRRPRHDAFALGADLALAASSGATVVFVRPDTEVRRGWLAPLAGALDDPEVFAACSLQVTDVGTVHAAGIGFAGPGVLPFPLLQGHPIEDLVDDEVRDVPSVSMGAVAVRAADAVALRGLDPAFTDVWEEVDLVLRARAAGLPGRTVVVPRSRVVTRATPTPDRGPDAADNQNFFRSRHDEELPKFDETPWRRAGLAVVTPPATEVSFPEPVLVRPARTVAAGPAAGSPSLRWAIQLAAPADDAGDRWGDVHFAEALAGALRRLGQEVVIDRRDAGARPSGGLDDVALVIRGRIEVPRRDDRITMMWLISHPDRVSTAELRTYDHVFAASLSWAHERTAQGVAVEPLLQATDPERFHPGEVAAGSGPGVLFVGDSRGIERPVVRDAIAAGLDVAIYGPNWEGFVAPRYVRATYLPNEQLPAAYRAAGVVLNDHWGDMAREGFVSNRLFDAVAAGARVISDPVQGLDELFSGAVRTYSTPEELRLLAGPQRDVAFPDDAALDAIAARVRAEHSFDARAARLLEVALAVHARRAAGAEA